MTDHPLTDDIIWGMWSEGDRSALAEEKLARAAADWQLEQAMEWLEFGYQADPNLSREIKRRGGFKTIAIFLEKAMRPQQQENN